MMALVNFIVFAVYQSVEGSGRATVSRGGRKVTLLYTLEIRCIKAIVAPRSQDQLNQDNSSSFFRLNVPSRLRWSVDLNVEPLGNLSVKWSVQFTFLHHR